MPPKKTTPSPASTSGRSMDNPTEEASRRNITNLTEPTSLSFDRTSGSVRDHVIEGGGESPAPMHRITILEDIRILPARTTMDPQQQQQTPVHPKTEKAPRMTPLQPKPARPAGSAREAAPRDASRERAAAQARPAGSAREAASRDASRERATAQARPAGSAREAASRDASRERATARARPAGSAREAASRDASRERATASAADVMALLGRTAAADAPRGSANIANPRKPPAPHLAARMGTTATPTIETKAMVAAKIVTPNVPQNTPATPATTVPARYPKTQATSRVTSEMLPPRTPTYRPRSRQSEGSARSDRSADSTPDRSGLLPATGPPLNEPRALVSTPTPGYGPNAPTPFSSTHTMETPRATNKRAREEGEEGDSGKRNPAVRPKTDPSPASQKSQEDPQIPSTSYAERVRSTHITTEKMDSTDTDEVENKNQLENTQQKPAKPQTQTKVATMTTTLEAIPAATTNTTEAPTQARKPRQKQRPIAAETVQPHTQEPRIPTIPTTSATTTAETIVVNEAKTSHELVNEPVVAARQGTEAKPESGNTANETVCEALIATLLEIIQDLQRGSSVSSIVTIIVRGLFQLVTLWRTC
ncbi:hypothetical protein ACJJTC_010567 [Scirpophaga incertulas]